MKNQENKNWWDMVPAQVGGDMIVGEVGAGANGYPAVGKIVGKAGEVAVKWVRLRFGSGKSIK